MNIIIISEIPEFLMIKSSYLFYKHGDRVLDESFAIFENLSPSLPY
ncbi:MAG: hypothetical protein ACTSRP_25740 [Candidatus Helarchaeota archaeon]